MRWCISSPLLDGRAQLAIPERRRNPNRMAREEKRADLVLEGGGVLGIAHVGAVAVFQEHGYGFDRLAGTSAGAIVAALVAAGMPHDEMLRVMRELNYSSLLDRNS